MEYKIEYDLGALNNLPSALDSVLRPVLSGIVGKVANSVYKDWVDKVGHAGGKGGIRQDERDSYAGSISLSYKEGDLSATIYTPYEQASQIEEGRPAYDLKQMLNTSTKVRMSKAGKKYLIIPFYHTQASLPSRVLKAAKAMGPSFQTGWQWQSNGLGGGGIYVERATYNWDKAKRTVEFGRGKKKEYLTFKGALPAGMAPKMRPSHKTDIYAGMRRMEQGMDTQARTGMHTFRVMVEGSSGWIIQARPGLYIVRDVVARGQALMNAEAGSALKG